MKFAKVQLLLIMMLVSFGSSSAAVLHLSELLAQYSKTSPQRQADATTVDIAKAQRQAANTLPAPEISIEWGSRAVSPGMSNETMFYEGLIVGQEFMWPGKRRSMQDSEEERIKMASANFSGTVLQGEYQVAQYYLEVHMAQQRQIVVDSTLQVMHRILESAQRRFETGMGSLEDLFRIKAEIAKLRTDSLNLQGDQAAMKAMLAASVGVTSDLDISPAIDLSDTTMALPGLDSLIRLARKRPEIQSMHAEKRMSEFDEKAASLQKFPDIMLQGKYMTMMGPDEWSIMAGIKIPVAPWASSEYKSKESLARSKQREAELKINAMQIMFVQQIRESYIRYNNNLAKLEQVNREQVTTAENAWQAAQIAYGSGKADLTMSLDALRMALMAWDESIMVHMQVLQSILNIEKASGVSPGTWMRENREHEGTSL